MFCLQAGTDNDSDDEQDNESEPETQSEAGSDHGGEAERSEDEVDEDNPRIPYRKLKLELERSFKEPINITVTATMGEILTNALTLVKKHNWNHTEKEDLMKFANSILDGKSKLPNTRFLLDQYFFSKEGMHYHFFCSQCTHFLLDVSAANLSVTQVVCPNSKCMKLNLLTDLSKATYFVTYDLIYQLQLLLNDPAIRSKLINPIDFISEPSDKVLRDLYHGSSYRFFANHVKNLPNSTTTKFMSFSLSVDSASLCSSFSGQSICPCFIMVNELPTVLRMKNLLIAGLWFGVVKEKLDLFLPPIVDHISKLSSRGFCLQFGEETWHVKAYLIACVADSVARCDVQGIHAHRGDFPCSWCLCEGEEYLNSRVFCYERNLPPARTIEELLEDSREALQKKQFVRGVKYLCLLSAAPLFHPVEGFIVDQMHAKDEGTTKAFLQSWLGEDGRRPYYIGKPNIIKVNCLLKKIKIPRELRKGVRSLTQLSYWTGREFENWLFFLSLSVLSGILPNRYLSHWFLYVQGTYLLLNSEIHPDLIDIAEQLLEEFCSKTEILYGRHMMRFNLHILRHFAENCRRWGPMYALSAYQYEAGNQRIKKLVHDCNGIPNQICRGISEDNALVILKDSCASEKCRSFEKCIDSKSHANRKKYVGKVELLGYSKPLNASEEEKWLLNHRGVNVKDCVEYGLMKKDGCHFGPGMSSRQSKVDNAHAMLIDKKIIQILKIIHNETTNDIWVLAHRMRCQPSHHCPSIVIRYDPSLCCQHVVTSVDEDVTIYDVTQLRSVCVNLPLEHGHYICPMPNIFNMF